MPAITTWRDDAALVAACLKGDEEAWSELIDKYKNLIFSVPIKYGFSRDEADDIFQAVCVELLCELPRLREARALPAWLMTVSAHKCQRQQRHSDRYAGEDPEQLAAVSDRGKLPEQLLRELEEEQVVRDAIQGLPARCRDMIHMLFFEDPPRPYNAIAAELGLATGSVGITRTRCLEELRHRLAKLGYK
ncbi:MAG: RNA polymerase sigma factor [Terriglobales bacterium]